MIITMLVWHNPLVSILKCIKSVLTLVVSQAQSIIYLQCVVLEAFSDNIRNKSTPVFYSQ